LEEALREEALREEALREEALREEALREEALREEALREEADAGGAESAASLVDIADDVTAFIPSSCSICVLVNWIAGRLTRTWAISAALERQAGPTLLFFISSTEA
jgi:hypothetical protein